MLSRNVQLADELQSRQKYTLCGRITHKITAFRADIADAADNNGLFARGGGVRLLYIEVNGTEHEVSAQQYAALAHGDNVTLAYTAKTGYLLSVNKL